MEMYSKFSQYYIEMFDELKGLRSDVQEYYESGEELPQELKKEYSRIFLIVDLLEREGAEKYNKEPQQMYKDGWDNWFKEDRELREKRYGKK
jgi:hypothetical protein